MAKLFLNKHFVVLILFLTSMFSFSQNFLILKGDKLDSLVNFKENKYYLGNKFHRFENNTKAGYYFFYKLNLYKYNENKISCLNNCDKTLFIESKKTDILPKLDSPCSIQSFVSKNYLTIPFKNSIVIVNLDNFNYNFINDLNLITSESNKYNFPKIFVNKNKQYYIDKNTIFNFSRNSIKKIISFDIKNSFQMSYFSLINSKLFLTSSVVQGDLGSFKVNFQNYNLENKKLTKGSFDGILRSAVTDKKDLLVVNYKKASIISELFSKNKVYFKLVKFKENLPELKTYSFKVTHKRNHVFYLYNKLNQLIALIQCKNGDIFSFNTETKEFKQEKFSFNYSNTLIRGINGGCFFDKENNNFSVVNFN